MGGSQVADEIHPLVQDSYDQNAVGRPPVEDGMATGFDSPVPRTDMRRIPAKIGELSQHAKRRV